MNKILVTGATGNIGYEVIKYLLQAKEGFEICAGVRNIQKAQSFFKNAANLLYVHFDFEDAQSWPGAFAGIDTVFLLRPPHISDTEKYFRPLIEVIKASTVRQIVFLSVQGAEKSSIIPHNKIEKLIVHSGVDYIFLRPSYFMQNLTTTLIDDIRSSGRIILPAGRAVFNWVDVRNIAEAAAVVLKNFTKFKNRALEITGDENLNFHDAAAVISDAAGLKINYQNLNPLSFFLLKKSQGLATPLIIVMIALHFLPRFQKPPAISSVFKELCGREPDRLKDFALREAAALKQLKPF